MHLTNQDSLVPQSGVVEVHPSEAFQTVTDTSHSSGCEYPLGIFFYLRIIHEPQKKEALDMDRFGSRNC